MEKHLNQYIQEAIKNKSDRERLLGTTEDKIIQLIPDEEKNIYKQIEIYNDRKNMGFAYKEKELSDLKEEHEQQGIRMREILNDVGVRLLSSNDIELVGQSNLNNKVVLQCALTPNIHDAAITEASIIKAKCDDGKDYEIVARNGIIALGSIKLNIYELKSEIKSLNGNLGLNGDDSGLFDGY